MKKNKTLISFQFLPDDKIVSASQKDSILKALLKANCDIDHSCGGMGSCGTCRVFIDQGLNLLEPRNELESEIAQERNFLENERLACQNKVRKGLVVRRPIERKKD